MMTAAAQAIIEFKNKKLLRKPADVDEYALARQRERGEQAKRLLEDPLFIEAFDTVEKAYMDGWGASQLDQFELRERAWTAVQLLKDLRAAISRVALDGTVAEEALTRLRSR